MASGSPDKKPVRLSIYNQTYSLLVSGDPADFEAAAQEVDSLMTTIGKSGNMDSTRIAVLACLHLQGCLSSLEREMAQLRERVEERSQHFSVMLDHAIEGEDDTPSSEPANRD